MEPHILQTLAERIAPEHTALVIIDMQKDLVLDGFVTHRAGRDLAATRSIIPNLERLLAAARGTGVVVCHVGFSTLPDHASDSGPWLAQRRRSAFTTDVLCMAGSEGAEFIDALAPADGELVIHKHRFSAFKGTDLDMVLRARGVATVITTGVSTNVCVESTLRDAFETGYYVAIPSDATASWNMDLHEATLQTVTHRFGLVTTTAEILAAWEAGATPPEAETP
jgi:ureidoacrylate peracid hydrolase